MSLREKLCREMSNKWCGIRGIEIFSLALESIVMTDVSRVNVMEDSLKYSDLTVAAGRIANATSNAMETAAANEPPFTQSLPQRISKRRQMLTDGDIAAVR